MPRKFLGGGSGYCIKTVNGIEVYDKAKDNPLPDEIEHIYLDYSLYGITDTAYGFLTRGCPRKCNFCHVKNKEGTKSIKVANLSEFWRGQKNIVLCDPNILACSERLDLLQQLVESKARVDFNQGLDVRLMDSHVLEKLRRIKVKSIHIAYDRIEQKDIIEPKMRMLKEMTGYGRNKVSVYILCNFDTTVEQDMHRIQFCRQLNFQPYPMIYDKQHADPIYRKIQRWCSPFIFWKTQSFNEYTRL